MPTRFSNVRRFLAFLSLIYLTCVGAQSAIAEAGIEPAARLFFGAKFEPPAGRALHGWGQISHGWNTDEPGAAGDMRDYLDYNGQL